jgi:hypothetical protein
MFKLIAYKFSDPNDFYLKTEDKERDIHVLSIPINDAVHSFLASNTSKKELDTVISLGGDLTLEYTPHTYDEEKHSWVPKPNRRSIISSIVTQIELNCTDPLLDTDINVYNSSIKKIDKLTTIYTPEIFHKAIKGSRLLCIQDLFEISKLPPLDHPFREIYTPFCTHNGKTALDLSLSVLKDLNPQDKQYKKAKLVASFLVKKSINHITTSPEKKAQFYASLFNDQAKQNSATTIETTRTLLKIMETSLTPNEMSLMFNHLDEESKNNVLTIISDKNRAQLVDAIVSNIPTADTHIAPSNRSSESNGSHHSIDSGKTSTEGISDDVTLPIQRCETNTESKLESYLEKADLSSEKTAFKNKPEAILEFFKRASTIKNISFLNHLINSYLKDSIFGNLSKDDILKQKLIDVLKPINIESVQRSLTYPLALLGITDPILNAEPTPLKNSTEVKNPLFKFLY